MIHKLKDKFSIDSVTIASENNFINVTQIPFPAVSIMKYSELVCETERFDEEIAKLEWYKDRDFEGDHFDLDCDINFVETNITDFDEHFRILEECYNFG